MRFTFIITIQKIREDQKYFLNKNLHLKSLFIIRNSKIVFSEKNSKTFSVIFTFQLYEKSTYSKNNTRFSRVTRIFMYFGFIRNSIFLQSCIYFKQYLYSYILHRYFYNISSIKISMLTKHYYWSQLCFIVSWFTNKNMLFQFTLYMPLKYFPE